MSAQRVTWKAGTLLVLLALMTPSACQRSGGGRPTGVLPLAVKTTGLPDGEEGTPYAVTLEATGGRTPHAWAVTAGSLPPGVNLDPGTGDLAGSPGAAGIFDFTVEVTDSQITPDTASAALRILVFHPPGSGTPPSVTLAAIIGTQRDLVDLPYKLVDPDGDPVTLVVTCSSDSGATWWPASEGPGGDGTGPLPSGPSGPQYVFQWDSMSDIGPVRLDPVRVRITPSDTAPGVPGETSDFTVDNRPGQLRFAPGPTLAVGRFRHTATLLADGTVLVAGGLDAGGSVLNAAEIYQPIPNQFVLLPSRMTQVRADHSATLLPDGRVLIAGGIDDAGLELASAEVYDPAAGTFQAVDSMASNRTGHAVVSTAVGVFVLGGQSFLGPVPVYHDDGEEYDPVGDIFLSNPRGPFLQARSQHHAFELSNGRILLAGGGSGTNLSLEEYDPVSNTSMELSISASAPQVTAHASVLLQDGTALVTGGMQGRDLISVIPAFDHAFVYDRTGPVGSRFNDVGPMGHSRRWHSATILTDGRVAVIGGNDSNFQNVGEAELYDPVNSTFIPGDTMLTPRFHHGAVRLQDGRVLVTGGTTDGARALGETEILGP